MIEKYQPIKIPDTFYMIVPSEDPEKEHRRYMYKLLKDYFEKGIKSEQCYFIPTTENETFTSRLHIGDKLFREAKTKEEVTLALKNGVVCSRFSEVIFSYLGESFDKDNAKLLQSLKQEFEKKQLTLADRIRAARGNVCEECGWNKGKCEVHHILPKSYGGSNDPTNLKVLCPNCHTLAHEQLRR